MSLKKLSFHPSYDSFIPASAEDKEYMVKMRPSSTFFKDGVKRLLKDKVATVSFIIIVVLVLSSIIIPMVWPYKYDQQLGISDDPSVTTVDGTYGNLKPLTYGFTERVQMLGKASVSEVFISAKVNSQKLENKKKAEAAKARLNKMIEEFNATDRSQASFAALKKYATGDDVNPLYNPNATVITFKEVDEAVGTTFKQENVNDWIWEMGFGGKSVRTPGEVEIIESTEGYHLVYFGGYSGETSKVFPHLFGTDAAGRDYFIRIVYGMRVSLAVGFFASIIVLIIGMTIGAISGYFGGKVDLVIMRIVDIIYSLPDMLMVILLAAAFKDTFAVLIDGTWLQAIGGNIISLFIVFALLYWVSMARLIRGQILSLREQEYVLAAKAAGAKGSWVIRKHLIPNCISVIIISTALQVPSAIFTESYLSFIGLGINAPMPSLGSLANEALNGVYSDYVYRLVIPAVVISLIVLSLNLFGDGLRDAFDPKLNS